MHLLLRLYTFKWSTKLKLPCISRMCTGLVDANNADDFRSKLLTVKELWNAKEQQYLPAGVVPTFYDYIAARVSN